MEAMGALPSTPAASFAIQHVKSSRGVRAWLVETPDLPIIALHFAFRDAGSVADPVERQGLAAFGAQMLTEGAGELGASAYQERMAELGATLTFAASRNILLGRLEAVCDDRDQTFKLLRLALSRPRFDAEAIARVRRSRLADLARRATDPTYVARRAWWQGVFPNHPYERDPEGTEADTVAITADDRRLAFMRGVSKENLIVSTAGAISMEELGEALDRVFGDLPDQGMTPAVPAAEFVPADPLLVRLLFPQSSRVFGHIGVRPTSPDYILAIVLNHIVGGGALTSRLFVELREKRGLAYSVHTRLEPLSDETLIVGSFATENDKVPTAMELVRCEWQRLASGAVTENDVDAAKAFLKGAVPLSLDGTSTMAGRLLAVQRLGLDTEYLSEWNAKIDAVTVEMVRALARRLMGPEALTFAIAGDPTGL